MCTFFENGHSVAEQSFQYWADSKPKQLHERPFHSPKVTVWCVISQFGIIGPYFFEENSQTVTITAGRYVLMLKNFFEPQLQKLSEETSLGDCGSNKMGLQHTQLRFLWPNLDKHTCVSEG